MALVAAIAGYLGTIHSVAQALTNTNIDLAHRLAPNNGRITALRAATIARPDAVEADRRRADRLARAALRQDPTAVLAVSTLGLDAQVRGDTTRARRLFAYAERLSRREPQTQLWAIEDSVARGDVVGALRHYDIVLRTKPAMSELLFPVLASASADPTVRTRLLRTLAGKPLWSQDFVRYLAIKGSDVRNSAVVLGALARLGVVIPEDAQAEMVNRLIAGQFFSEAWSYYSLLRAGSRRDESRDPQFGADLKTPSLFDWTPIGNAEVVTSIQKVGANGLLDFYAPSGVGGPMVQQIQLLPPGNYRLEGRSIGLDQATAGERPYWALGCRNNGRELGRVILPNSSQSDGRFAGRFSVPDGCPVQTLVLVAQPSNSIAGLSGQINLLHLVRVP